MAETNGIKGAWGLPEGGMGAVTQAMAKSAAEVGVEMFVDQVGIDDESLAMATKTIWDLTDILKVLCKSII